MSEKGFQFRTAAFGGFRKEDVLAYLEQSSREHREKIIALQRELGLAVDHGAEGEEKTAELTDVVEGLKIENQRLTAELTAATARRDELEVLTQKLQAELEQAGPAAKAYEVLKERTAGIELEAHGRAEAIEAEGRRKAKVFQVQVTAWFEKMCNVYTRMRSDLEVTMTHAQRELRRVDQNFNVISGDLASYDASLAELRQALDEMQEIKLPEDTDL